MSAWIMCNCCPSSWDCAAAKQCWNQRVTSATIHKALDEYDATRAKLAVERAAMPIWQPIEKPKKVLDTKPYCPHNERSPIGICGACGDWKL